ncbi:MAG: hypothetical protein IJ480_10855 [Clostridia bacterium]|nr:hypothetical protein [Clostridia bacterium]
MIHTSLVLRGRDNAGFSTDGKDNNAANVRDSMADTRYDFIRDTEEFRSILNDLNLYAGAWEKRA